MRRKPISLSIFSLLILSLLLVSCAGKTSQVTTLAGGNRGFIDGQGSAAQFDSPADIAVDKEGNVYVADSANHRVRMITPSGSVTTLAGNQAGHVDGMGQEALFSSPTGIAISAEGVIFIADSVEMDPHPMYVRVVTTAGEVNTLAGGTEAGYTDGLGSQAFFRTPANLAVDKNNYIYVADTTNHRIRLVKPDGMVSTFAGLNSSAFAAGYVDGPATQAKFNGPRGLAVDLNGNVYVADTGNHCIRKISPDGIVSTLAGTNESGFADGNGGDARFNYPSDVAVDGEGNIYVADTANHRIRKITPAGEVSTIGGSGQPGFKDGLLDQAQFKAPEGIAIDTQGFIYIADTGNHMIRKFKLP